MGVLTDLMGYNDRPATTSSIQQTPEEYKKYVDQINEATQKQFEDREYKAYTGETIAGLTPDQIAANEAFKGLVGTQNPYNQEALDIMRQGDERFTAETAQKYMSPYQRAVTDMEKQQAQRQYERTKVPQFEADAVAAGGMSGLGSRAGIEAAERSDLQNRLIGDIETRGLQSAYKDAQKGFADQKQRELLKAGNISQSGQKMFAAGLTEAGLLQDIGREQQGLNQEQIDEDYSKYIEEKDYDRKALDDYRASIFGSPTMRNPSTMSTTNPAQPSKAKSYLGMGLGALSAFGGGNPMTGAGNIWNTAKSWFAKEGGQINGGLNTLYRRQGGPARFTGNEDPNLMYTGNVNEMISGESDIPPDLVNFIQKAAGQVNQNPAPPKAAPPKADVPKADVPKRRTAAELFKIIEGDKTVDPVMAGVKKLLKAHGTFADVPGAMQTAKRANEVASAKEELKLVDEEEKANAKIKAEQIKAIAKVKGKSKFKPGDLGSAFDRILKTQLSGVSSAADGTLTIKGQIFFTNNNASDKKDARDQISQVYANALRLADDNRDLGVISNYINRQIKKIKNSMNKKRENT